jgi:KamA family protein
MLADERLAQEVAALAGITHIRRLRLHTRLPVILPSRITSRLLSILEESRFEVTWVIHANHPRELSSKLGLALLHAKNAGITLLNQAVLLKGVNDCADTLSGLSEKLFSMGVLPYYLHQLDRVSGAAHFEVPLVRVLELKDELRARLPGYLVPRVVREVEGREAKVELTSEACREAQDISKL